MKSMLFATAAVAGLFVAGGASANADQTANASAQQPQQQAKATVKKTVTVQSGDTLWGLSQKYNVSLSSLRAVNDRVNTDVIYVGEKLTLPSSATVSTDQKTVASATTNQSTTNQQSVAQTQQQAQPQVQQQTQSTTNYSQSQSSSYTGSSSSAKAWIANRESGGSYTASNGQYYGKYQLGAAMLHGDYSAANQERVADQYVAARYGSWDNAKSFWLQHGWY
ncbi:peptidoglycan-binding protein LysM [Apilactobacillus kunkeei]|uniref:Peptidoglycan-binding protein LysM n=2 Tax=Apilactobacillus kunkeei TaxID=148814 RepID=A0A1L8CGM7_9LACO|nr:LysM domain-containing protein [Apilactobacillus kunkeei]MCL8495803.1 LysM peptidoglycan-binding domain-containing protein [Apilactobacillus sp. F1]GAT90355.1 peptidoglycan-binding protein LysM [Apilactobacillus kunkeei]